MPDIKDWQESIEYINPYIVKISTPNGHGTGFLLSFSPSVNLVGIATAAHVINHAHFWEQPIRIDHPASGKSILLRYPERAIIINESKDTASIVFKNSDISFPTDSLALSPEGMHLKIGNEVGWLGFPNIRPSDCCFFSGRLSLWMQSDNAYLVDGVAIHGVSGGPSFCINVNRIDLIGLVSAYIPNTATGQVLPGLAVLRDVSELQEVVKHFKSIDEAKEEEVPVSPPPPNIEASPSPSA